jgi:L,D-transpeptidase YcbB
LLLSFTGPAIADTLGTREGVDVQVQQLLRKRIDIEQRGRKVSCHEDVPCRSSLVPEFYRARSYEPAWIKQGDLSPQIAPFLRALGEADKDGLKPEDYRLSTIDSLLLGLQGGPPTPQALSDLDLVLTDAFLLYASHQLEGRLNPGTLQGKWHALGRKEDIPRILENALKSGEMADAVRELSPQEPGYTGLRQALAIYRDIGGKGGWLEIPEGPTLRLGSRDSRVFLLRQRLEISRDLDSGETTHKDLFDGTLNEAVKRFQSRHGLRRDGAVGPQTLSALNVPVESRILQIEANMERWRWLPRRLEARHLQVNIADFKLEVKENGSTALEMPVIVGEKYKQTPIFSAQMEYLVFRPYWNIPASIAEKEILPEIQKDVRYLSEHQIGVYTKAGKRQKQIDPRTINWAKMSPEDFPYLLREEPGPENDLGLVKFIFPNRFDVYLHDTPARHLFRHRVREFSHGCIRVAGALDLAEYVLRGDPRWNRKEIARAMRAGRDNTRVQLPEPLPVYILYWTAWVDREGHLQFRNDIYGRDLDYTEALSASSGQRSLL